MPLDPQAQEILNQLDELGLPPNHTISPEEARTNLLSKPRPKGPEVDKVEDRIIANGDFQVPVRIYIPEGLGPFPVLNWFHGGGWVLGNLETSDEIARHLAVGTDCVVVSVDYRLAPEAKFPVPFEDCYAVTQWIAHNAASINVDPSRIAVGGDSAGGNLAAAVSLAAKDRGSPPIIFQLLVYPVTAMNFGTGSYKQNADGYALTMNSMKWYWNHYLSSDADASNPYAAPLAAKDLSRLPPALVITAEFDPLRDEGEAYAKKLQDAGVSATATRYDGMIHGFFGMSAVTDKGAQAISQASTALRAAFDGVEMDTK
jgi:acetyl esterase|tara:strand:- start:256 stop:1200 length:945 start_codon:yes stop_codon:yes gene_type:complete